ncbi:MAG TPA: hypothetical protein VGS06_39070 [Streptosporangiaceae bacterium]|nr:hypothetical protein [Streptosporangiaceae bacterium]
MQVKIGFDFAGCPAPGWLGQRVRIAAARRAERLLAAAEAGLAAGDLTVAARLAEQAETELTEPVARARVLRYALTACGPRAG